MPNAPPPHECFGQRVLSAVFSVASFTQHGKRSAVRNREKVAKTSSEVVGGLFHANTT